VDFLSAVLAAEALAKAGSLLRLGQSLGEGGSRDNWTQRIQIFFVLKSQKSRSDPKTHDPKTHQNRG